MPKGEIFSYRMLPDAIVCPILGILRKAVIPDETGYSVLSAISVVGVYDRILEVYVVDAWSGKDRNSKDRKDLSVDERVHCSG
jgi:hypothetical protein